MNTQGKSAIDELLAESFKQLATTKSIEKITIKEITDKAGVIRPTFYNHFQDKYELMEWIIKVELVEPMLPLFMTGLLKEGITVGLTQLQKDKSFYRSAARLEGQNSFKEVLQQTVQELFLEFLDSDEVRARLPYKWLTLERITDVYAETVSYVITEWIKDDMNIPSDELVDSVLYVVGHSSVDMMKELSGKQ